jgi:signal transduction histidine kinase
LHDDTALSLFRILQEALNNILRHAHAAHVQIVISCDAAALDLEINDDGKGFLKKGTVSGLGLKNIYTRAEAAGGRAYIASGPGEGTLLSVHIPLEQ